MGGLNLSFPVSLTCVIGPRGSGKSTLAEAIRYALAGMTGVTKTRLDLIQANLGSAVMTVRAGDGSGKPTYTIRRVGREPASLVTSDGKSVGSVDLERGTFLPLDAYASAEIEAIADESFGARRRGLLDELRTDQLHRINLSIAEKRRSLEANADAIRGAERQIADLTERLEGLRGARARLAALPPASPSQSSTDLLSAAKQQQANHAEAERCEAAVGTLVSFREQLERLLEAIRFGPSLGAVAGSANQRLIEEAAAIVADGAAKAAEYVRSAAAGLQQTETDLRTVLARILVAHKAQAGVYAALQAQDHAVSEVVRERQEAEQAVALSDSLEAQMAKARAELTRLRGERKALKGEFLLERERVSAVREEIARQLQTDVSGKVRVRVLRNADSLGYSAALTEGLKGARVRNHEDILGSLIRLRPEQLAQIILEQDVGELEHQTSLGMERCRRILESFQANLDPLDLEMIGSDDRVGIELNVSSAGPPNYKDAAELSRGQKCTALLPLLLARRDSPLLIDQPEDNLDNHFIYETVVESIRQLKERRQMIFITHNANIPVLAEAELVVVLNSDGKAGFVEKVGTLDECRDQIIDLLEGGKEAFELRRRRYQGER